MGLERNELVMDFYIGMETRIGKIIKERKKRRWVPISKRKNGKKGITR